MPKTPVPSMSAEHGHKWIITDVFANARGGIAEIVRVTLDQNPSATAVLSRYCRGAASAERIENYIAGVGPRPNVVAGKFLRKHGGVAPAFCGEMGRTS